MKTRPELTHSSIMQPCLPAPTPAIDSARGLHIIPDPTRS